MSPAERFARLGDEVRAELSRLDRVVAELKESSGALAPDCPTPARKAVAADLHAFYTGCEAVLSRLLRVTGEPFESGDWHKVLLTRAAAPLADVRPPIVGIETASLLNELLLFRHFFRNSYGVELDVERLARLATSVPRAHALLKDEALAYLHALETAG